MKKTDDPTNGNNETIRSSFTTQVIEENPYLQRPPDEQEGEQSRPESQIFDSIIEDEDGPPVETEDALIKVHRRRRRSVLVAMATLLVMALVLALAVYRRVPTRIDYGRTTKQTEVLPTAPISSANNSRDARTDKAIEEAQRLTDRQAPTDKVNAAATATPNSRAVLEAPVQNRLLKAIDEKQIKRLGDNHYRSCDVQIIAATLRNLFRMTQDGEFREDLYCRLAVLTVKTCPLRERREDIPAIVYGCLREAGDLMSDSVRHRESYTIEEDALELLCRAHYAGNIRSLRNLVFELTSYVEVEEPISVDLVQFAFARLRSQTESPLTCSDIILSASSATSEDCPTSVWDGRDDSEDPESSLRSIAREGDIILPLEVCVLRRGETFKQWTARAKHCSIEAARQATGGSMRTAAARLGLTRNSVLGHFHRTRQLQNQSLFDLEDHSD
jgi:transcriptional regulator of acetoin/glycerol metabolism